MVTIDVKIGRVAVDRIKIINTGEQLHGTALYEVRSRKFGPFHVQHNPKAGLNVLISHVFSHYKMMEDSAGDTPTKEEEI